MKSPVKSISMTEAQFNRVQERRPELIVIDGDAGVVGHPHRDFLEIHYGFASAEDFRDEFNALFDRCVNASTKDEAPRGVVLSFRDRPNRSLADTVFWNILVEDGPQGVEMNLVAAPEQPEPDSSVGEGYSVREATDADRDTIAQIDGEASGQPPLSAAGVQSIFENARTLRIVTDGGTPAGFVYLRTEPGGWGVVEEIAVKPGSLDALREPLLRWSIGWLRNNGGRRIRRRVYVGTPDAENPDLALLRKLGFTPGETGLDYYRPTVDAIEVKQQSDERKAHGGVIRFGNWR
jgi:hypothetical protein